MHEGAKGISRNPLSSVEVDRVRHSLTYLLALQRGSIWSGGDPGVLISVADSVGSRIGTSDIDDCHFNRRIDQRHRHCN